MGYETIGHANFWEKVKTFFKQALPYQETEYFELGESSFVTVYTKWFGFILAYSVFQVYDSTTIYSGNTIVETTNVENAPVEATIIEEVFQTSASHIDTDGNHSIVEDTTNENRV
jgi:hypothetical protein